MLSLEAFNVLPAVLIPTKKTLTQSVYETLREDIVTCRLQPAQKLKINELAERFDSSPGAVREALSRLTADDLVEGVAQKGFIVKPASVADLEDLTETRIDLECVCLERSIQRGGVRWEGQVLAAAHELRLTPLPDVAGEHKYEGAWIDVHRNFHSLLVSACGSPWRLRMRDLLHEQTQRYWHLLSGPAMHARDLDAEHGGIVEAALAHDAARATTLLRTHLALTSQVLLRNAAGLPP